MTVLGLDPGLGRMGWGLVRREGSRLIPVDHGLVATSPGDLPDRLASIQDQVAGLLAAHAVDAVASERLLFAANKTTAMDVAKALGAALAVVGRAGLPWCEYSPPEIKQSVVGNGAADKRQVQFMVVRLLGLREAPKPDDVADALAIAIAHILRSPPPGAPREARRG